MFRNFPRECAVLTVKLTPEWIWCIHIDTSHFESLRVNDRSVASAMLNINGMVRDSLIEGQANDVAHIAVARVDRAAATRYVPKSESNKSLKETSASLKESRNLIERKQQPY